VDLPPHNNSSIIYIGKYVCIDKNKKFLGVEFFKTALFFQYGILLHDISILKRFRKILLPRN